VQYFNNQAGGESSPALSNSRLQKAIERNRARMQKKESLRSVGGNQPQPLRGVPVSRRSSLPERAPSSSPTAIRKNWSKVEADNSVESRLEKLKKKRASRLAETKRTIKPKKTSSSFSLGKFSFKEFLFGSEDRSVYLLWMTKLSWIGLFVFFLHVCFGSRGVVEYYTRVGELENLKKEIVLLGEENNALVYEINQIENSKSYQKKVVRDYLGYISKDEHLIIFPEGALL